MNIDDIYIAETRIRPYLATTPVIYSSLLEKKLKKQVWLKLETQQLTGSFKTRPAFNSILADLELARKNGVIASSAGNFAQGVAFAAHELHIPATLVMMEKTIEYKINRTKQWGAEVILCGNTHEDRINTTTSLQQKTGRLLLHPYDSYETIAGDGTIGLEISQQLNDQLDANTSVLVPISGGGLIAGIALAIKTLHPACRIIGIQPKMNGSAFQSIQQGKCVNVGPVSTLADALIASMPGEKPFAIMQKYVDDILLVTEDEIASATEFLIEQHKLVVEPGAAVSIAALFAGKITTERCVCILSGGNINLWKK